ncbi:hypothetical protein LTH96_07800 [Nesterenkonia sp. LB17]|uniref:hypothetical protein n=1 Tax=unclassified Nesterenkonia TaxID=2629769 RepID=UPI001F4C600C|nr:MULTISPECIES: hypothetical protein [unclassified Nesterenkonia]MCH8560239.1 hypothetical protein [Nesterenkonia sp. DZ6]MCH8563757.1 hypothetical protein [Nesterenkonia sp. YGD6]MCH8565620.1 hypothetical protein [Nesterenkonia sp. LB17]MCH8571706.1 hypothetical protein [Nesterenkonia sp. AY15]
MSSQQSLPTGGASGAQETLKNFGRRTSGISFAVMITVLLVALVFAANQNDVIGWIIAVIAGGWLLLATVLVISVRTGAKKFGQTLDSARADAASRRADTLGGTAVVDEDTHARNLKLDHSFKIVQVQKRVITQELAKGGEADLAMVDRALDTIEMTAGNGRDMLSEHVGRGAGDTGQDHRGGSSQHREGDARRAKNRNNDDDRPITGEIVN